MNQMIRRLFLGFLIAFLILAGNLAYWQIFASEKLAGHPRNVRRLVQELSIERGKIISGDGAILAESRKRGARFYRYYPTENLLAPIIGFTSLRYGKFGLEDSFNELLLGGNVKRSWRELLSNQPARGSDLVLTIDLGLQKVAASALGKRRGAVIALDPRSGAILAMVSSPSYNPHRIEKDWLKISRDKDSPLLNRATQGLYPPGSVFKIITAAAAIETGTVTTSSIYDGPSQLIVYGGKVTNFADQGFGAMPFTEAFAKSCNTIFAQVGLDLTGERLVDYAIRFGFRERIPLEIPTQPSRIPSADRMDKLELAWSAVGQGRILLTPLQIALVGAAIANRGVMPRPFLVKEIRSPRGETIKEFALTQWRRPITAQTAQTVAELMVEAVESGTGKAAQISGLKVAGKTGTAELPDKKRTHAWFVGFAPADNPRIVVAVIVEECGLGGRTAAPVAKEVLLAGQYKLKTQK